VAGGTQRPMESKNTTQTITKHFCSESLTADKHSIFTFF